MTKMSHSKKYELNELEALERVIKVLKAKEEAGKYYIELKRKERSYNQLKLYWGEWLPAILYFTKGEIELNTVDELHIYLKEWYCMKTNKVDSFKKVKINGKVRYICMFSIEFEKASCIEMNDYMSFIENNFYELVSITDLLNIDELVSRYKEVLLWSKKYRGN